MDLVQEIFQKNNDLTASIKLLRQNGNAYAETERNYKVQLRIEALKLRNDQKMPVTLIDQIIYGVPEVADLRLKRDIAKVMYETNLEHINVMKLQIRLLEAQLNREWGSNQSD